LDEKRPKDRKIALKLYLSIRNTIFDTMQNKFRVGVTGPNLSSSFFPPDHHLSKIECFSCSTKEWHSLRFRQSLSYTQQIHSRFQFMNSFFELYNHDYRQISHERILLVCKETRLHQFVLISKWTDRVAQTVRERISVTCKTGSITWWKGRIW